MQKSVCAAFMDTRSNLTVTVNGISGTGGPPQHEFMRARGVVHRDREIGCSIIATSSINCAKWRKKYARQPGAAVYKSVLRSGIPIAYISIKGSSAY